MAARKITPERENETSVAPVPGTAPANALEDAAEAAAHLSASAQLIGTEDPGLAGFFAAFTRYASPEDLILYSGSELATLVRLIHARTEVRKPGTSLIETFVPREEDKSFGRSETIVLAVNDDMPFLFDSTTAEVLAQGLHIRAAFHPVIPTPRDPEGRRSSAGTLLQESFIVLALEHGPAKAELSETIAGLARIFADVKSIVRDWKPMLQRLKDAASGLARNPPLIAADELEENIA